MSSRRRRFFGRDLSAQRLQDKCWQATANAGPKKCSIKTHYYSRQPKLIEINRSRYRDNLGIVLLLSQEDELVSIISQSLADNQALLSEHKVIVIQGKDCPIQDVEIAREAIKSSSRSILVIAGDPKRYATDSIAIIRAFAEENQCGLIFL